MNELFIFPDYCYLLKIYYLLFIMLLFICTFYYDTSYFIFYSSCVSCKSASILFHVLFIMLLSFLSLSLSLPLRSLSTSQGIACLAIMLSFPARDTPYY